MSGESYDCIVIGTGGIGSAVVRELARRGSRVLGLDRFAPAHDRGSSHGQSRIIRLAYHEHPDYVPLLRRAFELWEALEQETGRCLYTETGILEVGPPDGEVIRGVLGAARTHGLDAVESLTAEEVEARFPAFCVPEGMVGALEPRGGYLVPEDCVLAHCDAARADGAELRSEAVRSWSADGDGVRVETEASSYRGARLVVTAGAWAPALLASIGVRLRVLRKVLLWYPTDAVQLRVDAGCPGYLFELPNGVFYGYPEIGGRVKLAEHSGGEEVADPLVLDRSLHAADRAPVDAFVVECLNGVSTECSDHAVCMYTVSPDHHFIVDRHPDAPQVSFAAGLSGHGFKFAPVLGEALADLATRGETELPIGFLGLSRFS